MGYKDITGKRNGKLVAVEFVGVLNGYAMWRCSCDCGGEKTVQSRMLAGTYGVKSCGCLLAERNRERPVRCATNLRHGHTSLKVNGGQTPEYICWSSMLQRCNNKKHIAYKNYGGKGIAVCQEWMDSFENFFRDMGPRPSKGHSIDRIDVKADYSKNNCRWATRLEQANNKSSNVVAMYMGSLMTASMISAATGVPSRTIYNWIKAKKSVTAMIEKRLTAAKRQRAQSV